MKCLKFLLISSICLLLFGCKTVIENENVSENANANNSITENIEQTNKNTENNSPKIVKEIPDAELTPSEVFREFDKAILTYDSEKIKQHITRDSIAFFEEEANQKGITFKELIEQTPVQKPIEGMPEIRNEKINGDTAIIEARVNPSVEFDKFPFIKENGAWKYAFDKFIRKKMKEMN